MKGKQDVAGFVNIALILVILLGATLGCLGPGKDSAQCEGTVSYKGETFQGQAEDEQQAGLNACNKFCLENDSEFDGMYQIWLESPRAKELTEKKKRQPTKQEAIMEDSRLLDRVTKTCANNCVAAANKGEHTLAVKCGG